MDSLKINGKDLYLAFVSGGKKIIENQAELNRINYFPVPDADTGTNLASTIRSILDHVRPHRSYQKTAEAISTAALKGARGNSGVILAQFLYGMSAEACPNESHPCGEISIENFTASLKKAVRYMYEAISNPVEGTMITVIREWAEYLDSHRGKSGDWLKLLHDSYETALQSLKETTKKLEVLARANVVDAGSKGIVLFIEGIIEFIKNPKLKSRLPKASAARLAEEPSEVTPESVKYRYCTETLIKGDIGDKKIVEETVREFGNSLVIAGSPKLLRLHIHTDRPAEFFFSLRKFGTLAFQKADDMLKQYEAAHRRKWDTALVTDSACDLPQEFLDTYQIHLVPINLFFGENHYLDKLTITPEQFYRMIDESRYFPKTAQPNIKTFQNVYSQLATHYNSIIAVHLSSAFSGTFNNSVRAAKTIQTEMNKRITVINSKSISGSQGLILLRAAKAIEAGVPVDDLIANIKRWSEKTRVLVAVKTLKYMVKGGRVSPMKGWIANLLNLKPIVSINPEGSAIILDKAFSQKGSLKNILGHVKKLLQNQEVWEYCILHAHNPDLADSYSKEMEKIIGKKPAFLMDISPVIGVHAGVGTVAVSLMFQ